MIIHPLPPQLDNGSLKLAARIELEQPPYNCPQELWFRFPASQAPLASDRADGFVVALLHFAMRRGENIHLRRTLSPRLAFGINEYQRIQSQWMPDISKPIEVRADAYAPTEYCGGVNASAFSGGVDSFYTLWSHLPQHEKLPGNELAYALFVHGLDIGLHDRRTFRLCRDGYQETMRSFGIDLLVAATNVRLFDNGVRWRWGNEVALIGIAHLLGRGLARFYIGASGAYGRSPAAGGVHLLDPLLSSESLQPLSDGAGVGKFARVQALAQFPASYARLRVCNIKQDGLMNCGRCDKCIGTMTALQICGALEHYSTFPKPLTRRRILFSRIPHIMLQNQRSYLQAAMAKRRYEIAALISAKIFLNSFLWGGQWVRRRVLPMKKN